MTSGLQAVAERGRLRAAINTGNRALVQQVDGRLEGVSPALAEALARELGVPLELAVYDSAGKVVADAGAGRWDIAFLAVDPERADKVAFTKPYVLIETTYAVREGSPIKAVEELDRPGLTILVSKGAAYDLRLTAMLQNASLLRASSPVDSMERFSNGEADAVAGIRQSLAGFFDGRDGFRILPGAVISVAQAMAVPAKHAALITELEDFLERAKSSGTVRRALDASGQVGLKIPD